MEQRKLTRQKRTRPAPERDTPEHQPKRPAVRVTVSVLDPHRWVVGDETGTTTARTRTSGRAPRGDRAMGTVPGQGTTVVRIAARRRSGVVAPGAFAGAPDTPPVPTAGEPARAPQRRPGAGVIGDHLKPHQDTPGKPVSEPAGAAGVPWPPSSWDRTPLAEWWSQAKSVLRSAAAQPRDPLDVALGAAVWSVRPEDIRG